MQWRKQGSDNGCRGEGRPGQLFKLGRLQLVGRGRQSEGAKRVEGTGREEEERRAGGRERQGGRNEGKQGVTDKEGGILWERDQQAVHHCTQNAITETDGSCIPVGTAHE